MESKIEDVRVRLEAVRRGVDGLLDRDSLGYLAAGWAGDADAAVLFALMVEGLRSQVEQIAARLPATVSSV